MNDESFISSSPEKKLALVLRMKGALRLKSAGPVQLALVWQYKAFTVCIMQYCNDR